MNEYLQLFRAYLNFEKGLSSNTLEAYSRDLRKFFAYLHRRGIKQPTEIKEPTLWITWLAGPGCLFSMAHLIYFKTFFGLSRTDI